MPTNFQRAFSTARNQGVAEFEFNGKQFNTQLKTEPTKLLQVSVTDKIREESLRDPSLKYVSNYNTGLTQQEYNEFYKWANDRYKGQENILYEMGTYDLQGAWKDIKDGKIQFDPQTGHLPDTYKKPNHITFSEHSKYHDGKTFIGGKWIEDKNKRWSYEPSPQVLELYGKDYLKDYFNKYEPDSDLIIK